MYFQLPLYHYFATISKPIFSIVFLLLSSLMVVLSPPHSDMHRATDLAETSPFHFLLGNMHHSCQR